MRCILNNLLIKIGFGIEIGIQIILIVDFDVVQITCITEFELRLEH